MDPKEKKIDKPLRRGAKMLLYYLRPYRRQIVTLSIFGVISSIATGSIPYLVGRFFDALVGIKVGSSFATLWPVFLFLGLWLAVQLIANLIDWIDDRLRRFLDTNIHLEIRSAGFRHLLRLPLSFHKSERIAETLERFNSAGWMGSSIVNTLANIVPQFLSIAVGITISFFINPILALILIAGVTVYVVIMISVVRQSGPLYQEGMKMWGATWDHGNAAATQADAVKQAVAEKNEEENITKGAKEASRIWYKMELVWNRVNAAQRALVMLTQFGIFLTSVYLIAAGKITPGQLVALNGYALMFFGPFVQLGYQWQSIQNGLTAAARTEEVIAMKQEEYHPEGSDPNLVLSGRVRFENVSFGYGDAQKPVLSGINLSVEPGQTIALVGESGVGKSTLISLISAYFFPTVGAVLIDGVDSRNIDLEALRRQIAVVPQEVALFNDTIEMNIRYGTFNATHADVVRAAREAHIDEFIEGLPKKYETIVGERGVKLSVGQKQRVAIARALLRDPKILILDEPTSALDAKTEKLLTESLEKLMKGRTTFIIAHRLSTVRKADIILAVESGTIVESGSHRELLAKNGVYKRLYDLQIGLHE